MVKVLILGSTGMLGSAVGKWFLSQPEKYKICLTYRNNNVSYGDSKIHFDCLSGTIDQLHVGEYDYVINCVGTIKPFMKDNPVSAIQINSIFPWKLSRRCAHAGTKLIHITTDCVYSGAKGAYSEEDLHDALDDYGKSKSLGEPTGCMVLRTSIIGEEIHKGASLVEWIKSQKGKPVNGYTNHDWNGITTLQYAKICDNIITNNLYQEGTYHIHSPKPVNKYELVTLLGNKFDLGITVNPYEAPVRIDRTLATVNDLCSGVEVPSIEQQIMEM